jgi:hypothetical protein
MKKSQQIRPGERWGVEPRGKKFNDAMFVNLPNLLLPYTVCSRAPTRSNISAAVKPTLPSRSTKSWLLSESESAQRSNDPAMRKYVYHFTTTDHLPLILKSRKLVPARTQFNPSQSHSSPPPTEFLWTTTNASGDPDAPAVVRQKHEWEWKHDLIRLVRFTLAAEDFEPWSKIITRCPNWLPKHIKLMKEYAREIGSSHSAWHCRTEPLAAERWLAAETQTCSGEWRPFDYHNLDYLVEPATHKIYHFTDTARLPFILDSRKLVPHRDHVEKGLPSTEFLWATSDEHGDRTADAMQRWDEATWCDDNVRLVRITLLPEDFEPWSEIITRCPQWTLEHKKLMESSARAWGVHPSTWQCRMEPLAMERWLAVETRSFLGSWQPFAYRDLDPVTENDAVLVIGDQAFLSRQINYRHPGREPDYDCLRVPLDALATAGAEFKRRHDELEEEWNRDRASAARECEQNAEEDEDEALYRVWYEAVCDDIWADRAMMGLMK